MKYSTSQADVQYMEDDSYQLQSDSVTPDCDNFSVYY